MTTNQKHRLFGRLALAAVLATCVAAPAFAAPPPKPPCGTNGALAVGVISPATYTYTRGSAGSQGFTFSVTSPNIQYSGNCDSTLNPVFGNGNGADPRLLPYTPGVYSIVGGLGAAVSSATDAAVRAALSAFATAPFQLGNPGSGAQTVSFAFTNSSGIPAGVYDITIEVQPESGRGVGTAYSSFTLQVDEAQAQDTLAPDVSITSPSNNASFGLNDGVVFSFTANDPSQGGVGTGVTRTRAAVTSCSGGFNYSLTALTRSPTLPVAASVSVTSSQTIDPWPYVGTFTLTAEADDNAGHTGSASSTFNVSASVATLPPISVPNRVFNVGSTVPVKFVLRDGTGADLYPMAGLSVRITGPGTNELRTLGAGAGNVRYETDEYGSVTQYITNFQALAAGTYTVEVLVDDVCNASVRQGSTFTFIVASKGR